MNALDYVIVAAYLLGLLGLGTYFRENDSEGDYFLGGRGFGWFPVALSVMATQLSAVSFISIPAFVGARAGGGMTWVSTELHTPITMLVLAVFLIPPLYRAGVISIYAFLERRIGRPTRRTVGAVFLVNRALATGTAISAVALVLEAAVGLSFASSIAFIGVVTVVYSLLGGMRAVIYGDAAQLIVLLVGIAACGYFGLEAFGSVGEWRAAVDPARLVAVDTDALGIGGDGEFGLWPLLIGGVFISVAYYGTDQSEAQRMLSAESLPALRRSLVFVGLVRYPVMVLYALVGLVVGPLMLAHPEHAAEIAETPDRMLPLFMVTYLPHGVIGLIVVAILAAAMSSLSSAINSLAAVTIEGYVRPWRERRGGEGQGGASAKPLVAASRVASLAWGAVILAVAATVTGLNETLAVVIAQIGSLSFGPILAIFVGAIVTPRVRDGYAIGGLAAGVALNVYLWLGVGEELFWIWWNVTGFAMTAGVLAAAAVARPREEVRGGEALDLRPDYGPFRSWEGWVLVGWFVGMLGVSFAWPWVLG